MHPIALAELSRNCVAVYLDGVFQCYWNPFGSRRLHDIVRELRRQVGPVAVSWI